MTLRFQCIGRYSPTRRARRVYVELRQTHHQVGDDVERDMVRGQRPIEARGFCAQVDAESFWIAAWGKGVARRDEEQREKREDDNAAFSKWVYQGNLCLLPVNFAAINTPIADLVQAIGGSHESSGNTEEISRG